ncbi:hypothetical protein [Streptomyces anandii]|uniref:hypothetical protein n=1 Tax=Streptomyces anandii TaxID=285454 RepID=UPI0036B51A64
MTDYLNFTKVIPNYPNDPLVNLDTQINANWDLIDTQLRPYIKGGTISNLETGQEFFDVNFRYALWDGTATRIPDAIDSAWSAWTSFPVASGKFARPGFTPKWRNNSLLRMVECAGGFQIDSAQSAWPMGALTNLNADSAGAIPASMVPNGGYHIGEVATALTAGTSVAAAGYVYVDKPAGNTFVRIRGQYMGGPGGGNFMMLDQLWWWY